MKRPFNNIRELLTTLKREEKLIIEMFNKRKSLSYRYSYALELVEYDEGRLQYLIDHEVIRQNGQYLDLDDLYLDFFEQVLDINEEINIATVDENIKTIKENIDYYLNEHNENRKYSYLKNIKRYLRKIGKLTLKNVIDLRRNVDNTFKNEPNYKIKKKKLENLDNKRDAIQELIKQSYKLIKDEEITFFKVAPDEELNQIIWELKEQLNESNNNLIEIEKQIIDYLNQIKIQAKFVERVRILKYLKDQFLIEAETDIRKILSAKNEVFFENRITEPLKLSVDYLNNDDNALEIIKKVAAKIKNRKPVKLEIAGQISDSDLSMETEEEDIINLEEIKNQFVATSNHLFDFILNYNFEKNIGMNEKVTIFCQIVALYENELDISDEYQIFNNIEFAIIYPK